MADYVVSARKYRPATFNTVVGQKALVQTLKNAIASGKLAHAYLFCGPRGVGKTTCARIFAKTINCENRTPEGEACNECESCRAMGEQRSYNVYELDAASNNSVDNIRELIDQVQIPPQIGKYKVFIIDEVHMLSTQAFNAFLKTLEEPPKHAIFVMCTTEKQKILPTILSRCQTYDFQRISTQDIVDQLRYIADQEGIQAEQQALQVIARKADGGMRDALSVFDQIASFTGGNVTYQQTIDNLNILDYELFFRLTDAALQGNVPAALMMLDQVIRRGFDPQYFIGGWASHLRDLMVSQDPATIQLIEAGQEVAQRYAQQAVQCKPYFLYNAVMIANECDFNYRNSRNKRLSVEIAMVRICQLMNPVAQPSQPQKAPMQAVNGQLQAVVTNNRPQTMASSQPQAAPATHQAASTAQPQSYQTAQPQVRQAAPAQMMPRPQVAPQPQSAPQPAMQPRPQVAPGTMAQRGAVGGRPMMASLHGLSMSSGSVQNSAAAPASQQAEQNEPVDESALRRTWNTFIQKIPTEKLLATAMGYCQMTLQGGTTILLSLSAEEQKLRIAENQERILSFLRQQLHNTHLKFEYEVHVVEGVKRAFTPREKMEEIRKEYPETITALVEAFGLELS